MLVRHRQLSPELRCAGAWVCEQIGDRASSLRGALRRRGAKAEWCDVTGRTRCGPLAHDILQRLAGQLLRQRGQVLREAIDRVLELECALGHRLTL